MSVVSDKRTALKLAVYFGAAASSFVLALVLLFSSVSPPITPLIAHRASEQFFRGRDVRYDRRWIPLSRIPVYVQQAVVTAEDARFMGHRGVDFKEVWAAFAHRNRERGPRGASTITMQTVRSLYLWPGRSYLRKLLEVLIAPLADVIWGKRRTLELYLNYAEWGDGIYGIEAAAHRYFGCGAQTLSPSQAAQLASVLPNPRGWSPRNPSGTGLLHLRRVLREYRATKVP